MLIEAFVGPYTSEFYFTSLNIIFTFCGNAGLESRIQIRDLKYNIFKIFNPENWMCRVNEHGKLFNSIFCMFFYIRNKYIGSMRLKSSKNQEPFEKHKQAEL